ncbi:EI24 domain-containing protein [Geopsychrobacter electrodiphilus]|uniref:EI24 domain-containing protein n=1 Tax=Geopsychrobacter electrodiphilus TaxID=225196 RepID=UPI0003708A01|nr:EI24 domain-containing protein [Geopsychrobacter electrodiphilus]
MTPMTAILKPVASFGRGFGYVFQAPRFLLKHPGLLRFVAIPFFINLVIFSVAVYFGLDLFNHLLDQYLPQGNTWYLAVLYYFAWMIAGLLTMVVVFFGFTVFGNLLASPFNELLSERIEVLVRGSIDDHPFALTRFVAESGRTLLVEFKKQLIFIVGMVLLLLINLLPGLGPLAYAVLAPLFTLFFLVIEYLGFVLMRKQLSFGRQYRYVFGRPLLMAGFGSAVFCLLAIPLLQFFCIPLAVSGATLLWCDFPHAEEE